MLVISNLFPLPSLTENKESVLLGKSVKEDKEGDSLEVLQQCKTTSLVANSTEQGSTLRDLLTTTAGKLKLGSTDAGIAFAPVYSTASQVHRLTRLWCNQGLNIVSLEMNWLSLLPMESIPHPEYDVNHRCVMCKYRILSPLVPASLVNAYCRAELQFLKLRRKLG